MAIPLSIVLSAAPGIVSAAAELVRLIKHTKQNENTQDLIKVSELENVIEKQAKLIEDLAINNKYLVQAVKINRKVAIFSLVIAVFACILAAVL